MSQKVIFFILGGALLLGVGVSILATKSSPTSFDKSKNVNSIAVGDTATSADCEEQYHALLNTYGQDFSDCSLKISTANSCAKAPEESTKKKNIVLILDASGSMAGLVGGNVKMEAAKNAAKNFISTLDANYNLSFVLYGHKGDNTPGGKAASCSGIEEIYPLSRVVASSLTTKIDTLKATGWTPLAGAIEKAGTILAGKSADKNSNLIILLTDGEETCGGDPSGIAKKLFNEPEKIVTNVISFDLSEKEAGSLEAIASAGHGTFVSAANENDLTHALAESRNFMASFGCYMKQSDVWLTNSIDVENKYGECENRLQTQEKLPLTQAIDLKNGTTPSCTTYLRDTYENRYKSLEQMITDAHDSRKNDSEAEKQKLEQINSDKNDNKPFQAR